MSKDAPAFDFYPERWLSGVAAFSDLEQLAYLRLLCHQWLHESLPDALPALKRLGGRGVTPALLVKFPLGPDGRRRNLRLETIRSEQRERIAKRRDGAAKTNAKRWGKGAASVSLSATPGDTSATQHHPPPTTHPNEERASQGVRAQGSYPALEEVQHEALRLMVPPECAAKFWNDCEASGWVNRHGQPIADWRPLFRNFATAWKANDARQRKPRHPAYDPDSATAGLTPKQILDF